MKLNSKFYKTTKRSQRRWRRWSWFGGRHLVCRLVTDTRARRDGLNISASVQRHCHTGLSLPSVWVDILQPFETTQKCNLLVLAPSILHTMKTSFVTTEVDPSQFIELLPQYLLVYEPIQRWHIWILNINPETSTSNSHSPFLPEKYLSGAVYKAEE